jgi:hypothetical protein
MKKIFCMLVVFTMVASLFTGCVPKVRNESGTTGSPTAPASQETPAAGARTWTRVDTGTQNVFYKVIWDGKQFVAAGQNLIMVSKDGTKWETKYEGPVVFFDIMHDGSRYLAPDSVNQDNVATILLSEDLVQWQKATIDRFGYGTSVAVNTIAYGNGLYIAVGGMYNHAASSDGTAWETQYLLEGGGAIRRVAYTDGQFILTGTGGTLFTSPDGKNWRLTLSPDSDLAKGTPSFQKVAAALLPDGIKVYIVTDSKGGLYMSLDRGETLVKIDPAAVPSNGAGTFSDILWDGERFLAINPDFALIASPDGREWTVESQDPQIYWGILSMAFNGETYVLAGLNGGIATRKK